MKKNYRLRAHRFAEAGNLNVLGTNPEGGQIIQGNSPTEESGIGGGKFNIGSAISGGMGLVTSGINAYKRLSTLPGQEDKIQELKDVQNASGTVGQLNNIQSLEDLANSLNFAKTDYNANLTGRMGEGEMAGEIIKESLMQSAQGAMAGLSAGGPWGALIGGIIGGVQGTSTSVAGVAVRNQRAQALANRLNAEGETANKRLVASINDRAGNITLNNANMARLNMAAFGGPLHSGTFDNGVRFITEGGSHEKNPFGGVLQGMAADGLPNLVEEGEVIYNDYVYSKRLNVPDKDKESLGLKKNKDYTYADAAELLQRESEERPNDALSKRNLEAMMLRLQDSQEQLKQQREERKFKRDFNKLTPAEQMGFVMGLQQEQQQPQMMPQAVPQEYAMATGGILKHLHADGEDLDIDGLDIDESVYERGFPGGIITPFTKEKLEEDRLLERAIDREKAIKLRGPLSYEEYKRANPNYLGSEDDYNRDMYDTYGEDYAGSVLDPYRISDTWNITDNHALPQAASPSTVVTPRESTSEMPAFNYSSGAQALRAMPVLGSTIGALTSLFDKPDYSTMRRTENKYEAIPHVSATPVGERLTFNPIDVNYIATQMNNQGIGARRAAMESGAGYSTPYNIYQGQTALGDAFIKAMESDNRQRQAVGEFNRQTSMFNSQQALAAAQAEMQRGAALAHGYLQTGQLRDEELGKVQAARSLQLTKMFDNLGALGQDMLAREMNAWLANRGVYGTGAEELTDVTGGTRNRRKQTQGKKGGSNA